jgi:type IV pilus assembly protein PilB
MTAEFLRRKKIGEILVEMHALKPAQLEAALKKQGSMRKMIGEILIEEKAINEETLYRGLSTQHGIEYVNLDTQDLNRELIRQIPESLIKTYKFLPLKKEPKSLTIAVFDPSNTKMFDSIKLATGYMFIKWVLAAKSQIIHIINDVLYRPQNVLENVPVDDLLRDVKIEFGGNEFSSDSSSIAPASVNLEELKRESDQTAIVTLVNKIILDAVRMRTSDIHIEAFEAFVQIRYRIDGILYDIMPVEKAAQMALISRIKIMSNLDITERIMPQDGSFKLKVKNQQIEFRVAILPSIYGQNCTIRVLDAGRVNLELKGLGFLDSELSTFERCITKPWGMILIAGPTGSGKTTTLYSAVSLINSRQKKIITIEDPVEFKIPGVHQMQVAENKIDDLRSLTFAKGLRAILRLDPDIILVGEVRDYETAEITVKAALTGHLVFSTIHANTAIESVTRLENLGVDPYLFASSLVLLAGQRLVRKICPACKIEVPTTPYVLASLGLDPEKYSDHKFYRGSGCRVCNNSGFRDRTGLFEIIEVSSELRDLLSMRQSAVALLKYLRSQNIRTIQDACLQKVLDGEVPVEEYLLFSM